MKSHPPPPAPHLIADANKIHPEGVPALLMKSRGDSSILTVAARRWNPISRREISAGRGAWRVLLDDRLALESEFTLVPRQPAAATKAEEKGRTMKAASKPLRNYPGIMLRAVSGAAAGLPGDAAPLGRVNCRDVDPRRNDQSGRSRNQ